MLKFKTLQESIRADAPKIVVYGPSGVGKTSLIPTLRGRVLILSAEDGLLSLSAINDPRFAVAETKTIEAVAEAYQYVVQNASQIDWVVLDSLSEIAEVLLAAEKRITKDPRNAYGALGDRTMQMMRQFRELPIGVVFLAKRETKKLVIGDREVNSYGVKMPQASLVDQIPHVFDEVFHYDFVQVAGQSARQRLLQTNASIEAVAKDRSGTLAPYCLPDLQAIADSIKAGARIPNTATNNTESE